MAMGLCPIVNNLAREEFVLISCVVEKNQPEQRKSKCTFVQHNMEFPKL
jgi:hypothetical protein